MDDSATSKTGSTLNKNIRIKPSIVIDILNAIENSKNIECISYSSLYGFVFRVQLEEYNSKKFNINTSHNSIDIFKLRNNGISTDKRFNPTHIVLKFTVLVDKDNVRLNDCFDVYSGEKYIKYTNTVSDFNNEVSFQKSIYDETKGENNIAICPRIFQNYNFENRDAIEFLEFFDKNISDNVCTYVVKYLLGIFHDENKKLGVIVMEYVKLGDEGESGKIMDTRITLYKFLTYQGRVQLSGQTETIVDRLIEILPTLKKDPMFLYNYQVFTTNSNRETRVSKNTTFMNHDSIKNYINTNNTTDRTELEQLEYLKLNYYKYRILAHVIYYMMRAYQVGYIHNDLHSNNIFVVNPYLKIKGGSIPYNGCLHPFSLNDVGIGELDESTRNYQEYLFMKNKYNESQTACTSIQNYCNLSCIQIIDWGRTTPSKTTPSETPSETTPSETTPSETPSETAENSVIDILDVLKTINILKKKYTKYSYIFYNVGLNSDIQKIEDLQFPQFYVIWLIWNEYEKKVKAVEQAKNEANENIKFLNNEKTVLENVNSTAKKAIKKREKNIQELRDYITNAEKKLENAEKKLENAEEEFEKAKNVFKQSTKGKTVVNENDPNNEKIKKKFYEFLILFKTNCEFNTFYETLEYNVNTQLVKKK
jgi:hypothetical protein